MFLTVPRSPDFVIGGDGTPYMRRWWLIPRNRWFNLYLHNFKRSDDDRALHDHPWWNVSIVLSGGYLEYLPDEVVKLRKPWRPWTPWRLVFRKATAAHRIEMIQGVGAVWSLFVTGPTVREWGFHCPQGWRHHDDFISITPGGNKIGKGCE